MTGDLHAQLDRLERMAREIGVPLPSDDDPAAAVVAALLAVDRQHPGAWVPLKIVADYRTERTRYNAMEKAIKRLVHEDRAEALTAHFREGERRLYRIAASHDVIDIAAVLAAANAALAPVHHKVLAFPSRLIESSFTRHTVTHAGRTATAYLRVRQYDLKLSRSV